MYRTTFSRFSPAKISLFNSLVSFMSTGTKYVVNQGGKAFTGVVGKVTTTITLTFRNIHDNNGVLNKELQEFLRKEMLELQKKFPDAIVSGLFKGDHYETQYYTKIVGEVDNNSEGYEASGGAGKSGSVF